MGPAAGKLSTQQFEKASQRPTFSQRFQQPQNRPVADLPQNTRFSQAVGGGNSRSHSRVGTTSLLAALVAKPPSP